MRALTRAQMTAVLEVTEKVQQPSPQLQIAMKKIRYNLRHREEYDNRREHNKRAQRDVEGMR